MYQVSKKFILWNFRLADEPRCEKTGLRGFRPGPTQIGLYNYRICCEKNRSSVFPTRADTDRAILAKQGVVARSVARQLRM